MSTVVYCDVCQVVCSDTGPYYRKFEQPTHRGMSTIVHYTTGVPKILPIHTKSESIDLCVECSVEFYNQTQLLLDKMKEKKNDRVDQS